ncbi:MAG: hypothetical protein CSA15_05030, partial [Candidatus Delongbacteria bacterium]
RIVLILILTTGLFINLSCNNEDEITQDIELVSGETLDLGDVPAGSSVTGTFTVKGVNLSLPIYLNTSDQALSLNKDFFPAANINNEAEIVFSPEITATQGSYSGSVEITSEDIVKTLNVVANIVEPVALPDDTEVYVNTMEFGLDHGSGISVSDFENADAPHSSVSVTYTLKRHQDKKSRIKVNKTSSKCNDNTVGDCGNAVRIVGPGTKVTILLSGLEADRSYDVSYWIRPDGSSDRSMDVTVTGDTTSPTEDWGGHDDRSFYTEVTRKGIADESGNLEISFEYTADSKSRTISIDDIRVKTRS